jgi:lysophospholipase L1-like esterase
VPLHSTAIDPRYDAAGVAATLVAGVRTPVAHTIVPFGDSITAFNIATSPPTPTASAPAVLSSGFFNWANIFLGQRFQAVANLGVGGDTSSQALGRLDPTPFAANTAYAKDQAVTNGGNTYTANVAFTSGASFVAGDWKLSLPSPLQLSPLPKWCNLMIGTNDMASTSVSGATVLSNITTICNRLLAAGINVLLNTITPNYGTAPNTTQKTALAFANRGIRDYARTTSGVVLADTYAAAVDPSGGNWKTNYSADSIHPRCVAAFAMGQEVAAAISPYVGPAPVLSSSNADLENILTNGMFIGSQAEVDVLTVTGAPTGGSTILSFVGPGAVVFTTAAIPYNSTAAAVAAAVQAATGPSSQTLPSSAVTGTGGPWPTSGVTLTWATSVGMIGTWTHTDSFTGGTSPNMTITRSSPGGLATGWTNRYGVGQATLRKIPRTDLAGGEWQEVELTNWQSGSFDIYQGLSALVVGGAYQAQVEFQGDPGMVNVGYFGQQTELTGGGTFDSNVFLDNAGPMPNTPAMFSGVLRSVPQVVQTGQTGGFFFLRFGNTAGGFGKVRWGRASLIRVA